MRHVAGGNLRADGHRPLVPGEPPGDRRDGGAAPRRAALQSVDDATLRQAKQFGFSDRQLATIWRHDRDGRPRRAEAARHRRLLQGGRHLRRRVRGLHALLLFDLRRRGRDAGEAARATAGDHPRRRAQPHRPGHRVRLLLLPRQLRPARAGHPVDHGQLEPRDRLAPTTTPATCCSSSR